MGGKAFSKGPHPLLTPRMPPDVYYKLRDRYLNLLSTFFVEVATPIEAPSKASYGDIDILVSQPKSPLTTAASLSKVLGTVRTFTISGSGTSSFALPHPNLTNQYVQMDLHLCPSSAFHWQVFQQSHGDLWSLLGTAIRPFGLTANDVGLHLRVAEIEELNRKRNLVFLTNEPQQVLDLLDLDTETYWRPFESLEKMYKYVVQCRFFRPETYVRSDLRANDRKRMTQRPLYRCFVDDWLPENAHWIGRRSGQRSTPDRECLAEMVLLRFQKRQEYERRIWQWKDERDELLAKQEGRKVRKSEALESEKYADSWIRWLKHDFS